MTLSTDEFLRRFAQHILPRGLVRIRAFGYLAGPRRVKQLATCRELLSATSAPCTTVEINQSATELDEPPRCPHCHVGVLQLIEERTRPRVPDLIARTYQPDGLAAWNGWDTS